ncbi:MAG: PAS domain S-box protein, partial [Candidatus Bathyarchaeia archaeon]
MALTGANGKSGSSKKSHFESDIPFDFPIVGIGASAGGLEAFRALLEYLPVDTGLAFVIIQHLAAGQESMLTDILSRFTTMPVLQVEDGLKVEPDNVYVIPPGSTMTLTEGTLKLNPKGKSLRPIDDFLRSLAIERKTQAIGIVLSGTGADGTEGLKAVKADGGITFAQKPDSAQYAGMPQSAISAEVVDFILTPDKIAKELSKIAKNPHLVRSEIISQEPENTKETGLRKIFTLLKTSFSVDFSHYKDTVINRRVTRRMVINHIENITNYAEYLETNHTELKALFHDMLIGVTSFFREPKTFETLKEKLLPELLKNREPKEPLRIWIPGCSTGEEAYSFAIAIQEFLEENGPSDVQVQIFGTDVNEKNVDKARQGIYPKSIETDVSENRLKRFFTSFNGSYQIAKFIRDKCVFAKQDLTADPPFSNLDLISCRNMLIYFDSQLQERIVPILHYALKPDGFLILGESESIGKFTTLFEPVHKKSFIYTKKADQSRINFGVNFGFEPSAPHNRKALLREPLKKDASALLRDKVDRLLITEYVPATMLVNSNLDILFFRGNVLPYLSPESGQTSLNITRILRKDLRSEVQTLVFRAKKENKTVTEEAIRFQFGELEKTVNIQVIPLPDEESFFLVLFEDVSAAAEHLRKTIELTASPKGREDVKDTQIRELKEELDSSKQTLNTIVENQEATNEELRSAMEEVQSSNEELQSTNEELETAKEELQSTNEELTTLNDELKNRNQALGILSDNQANLNKNVDPAVVMVDGSLKIRLFTPSAQTILNLVPSDVGLPLSNIRLAISVPDLEKTILGVVKSLGSETMEVSDEKGRFYELRIRPYVTEGNRIDGAVLSFIDVNESKRHENQLQLEEIKYRTLAENSPDIIARLDRNSRYLYVNIAIEKLTGIPAANFIGKTDREVGMPKNLAEAWNKSIQNTIKTGEIGKGEMEVPTPKGPRIAQFVIVPEFSVAGNVETVLVISKDITVSKKLEDRLKESEERFLFALKTAPVTVGNLDCDLRFTWVYNPQAGYTSKDMIGSKFGTGLNLEDEKGIMECLNEVTSKGIPARRELRGRGPLGEVIFDLYLEPKRNAQNEITGLSFTALNITERKKAEEALAESEQKYRTIVETAAEGIVIAKLDGTHIFVNNRLSQMFGYSTGDLLKKSSFELMSKEEQKRQASQMRKSLENELIQYREFEFRRKDGSTLWAACNASPLFDENGKHVSNIALFSDITERKKTDDALKKSEAEYSSLFANMIDGFAYCQMIFDDAGKPIDFVYLQINDAFERITGLKRDLIVGKKASEVIPGIREDNPELFEIYGRVALTGQKEKDEHFQKYLNVWLNVSVYSPAKGYFAAVLEDITERKKSETEREIMVEFLKIANANIGTSDLIEGALAFFQKQCGCEAVGIRLKEGEEYPYFVTRGFPPEHVRLENQICARDDSGYIVRDSKGNSIIECMCGAVVSGKFDPSKEFFTEKGSFWTNNTTLLLATTTAESRGKTRNCCNREGYESIALIPLAIGDTRLGLLQLNDKRKGMFTLEMIQMWERIADRLASALSRTVAEEALEQNEVKFRTVADFANDWEYWIAPDGHMIYVSPSSKRITGYDADEFIKDPTLLTGIIHPEDKSIVGSHFDLISSEEIHAVDFRIVTRDGQTRWISHSCKAAFDDNDEWIGRRASNRDITERKKMEQALSNSLEESYRRGSEISALLTASRAVLQNKEFPDSARAIFDTCKELIGATAGYVALLSKNGKENEVLFLDSGGRPCTVNPSLPMPIRGLRAEAY